MREWSPGFQELKDFCRQADCSVSNDVAVYDADLISNWVKKKGKDVDCEELLNFWNITSDLARSANQAFYGDKDESVIDVYNKLFYGTNPASLKGDAEDYTPAWDEEDLSELRKVMEDCVRIVGKVTFWEKLGML